MTMIRPKIKGLKITKMPKDQKIPDSKHGKRKGQFLGIKGMVQDGKK